MPLARIDLPAGKPAAYLQTLGEVLQAALTGVLNVPHDDRFQLFSEHAAGTLVADAGYLGMARTADFLVIQVTLNDGRTVAMKQAFYKAVADGLHERLGLRREDVMISLVSVHKEDWSYGNGVAQYA